MDELETQVKYINPFCGNKKPTLSTITKLAIYHEYS